MVPLHIFAPILSSVLSVDGDDARFSEIADVTCLQRFFSCFQVGKNMKEHERTRSWKQWKLMLQLIFQDPQGSAIAAVAAASPMERCAKLLRGSSSTGAFSMFLSICKTTKIKIIANCMLNKFE